MVFDGQTLVQIESLEPSDKFCPRELKIEHQQGSNELIHIVKVDDCSNFDSFSVENKQFKLQEMPGD